MRLATLCAALLGSALAAQTPPCFGLNDATTTVSTAITSYGFAGQNTRAWQIAPPSALVVESAQVFTRNSQLTGDRYMTLEIWDDANGLPNTRLGGGTWKIVNSRPIGWVGATLDAPVVLLPNQPYWVVWIEPGFSVVPTEPGGIAVPRANRSGGGVWSGGATEAPKLRLGCSPLDGPGSQPVGLGCALSTGWRPTVFSNEAPNLGNSGFFFECSGNPTGGVVFALLGLAPNFTPSPAAGLQPNCFQNTDIVATLTLTAGTGTTRGPTAAGYVAVPLAIPADPALTGQTIALQTVPFDAGSAAPLPFAASNAQRITLF